MNSLPINAGVSRYSSIDVLLGESQTRFFGAGYRSIRRQVSNVALDARAGTVEASAAIRYPAAWSTKRERELQPHLSSIDALALAAQLAETYLRVAYGVEGGAADSLWIERCLFKPGQTPTTDLERVAVRCALLDTQSVPDSLFGHRSRFAVRVGTISVELSVEHQVVTQRDIEARWGDIEDVLGPAEASYYGSAYTADRLALSDVEFDKSGERVAGTLDVEPPANGVKLTGMGAAYYPFVSELTTIVSVAQLAQALLYRYDGVTREQSNNLWMRKILLVSPRPVAATRDLHVETWSTKMSLLPVKDGVWRSGNFELALPGVTGEYTLAHLLPASAGLSAAMVREAGARGQKTKAASRRGEKEKSL